MRNYKNILRLSGVSVILLVVIFSCKEDILPKPKAQLRLQYPDPTYELIKTDCPYIFEKSSSATLKVNNKCWVNIDYQELRATVNMTYRPVDNNLKELFLEAEKLTFNHTIKADGISSVPYANKDKKVYGSIFEVTGNAASPIQFHVTDSLRHFITGAVYFNVQPNYDSIKPAISYIQSDIVRMIESMEWKN
jgi:gliding motility-associated lipoprotein GldD